MLRSLSAYPRLFCRFQGPEGDTKRSTVRPLYSADRSSSGCVPERCCLGEAGVRQEVCI